MTPFEMLVVAGFAVFIATLGFYGTTDYLRRLGEAKKAPKTSKVITGAVHPAE